MSDWFKRTEPTRPTLHGYLVGEFLGTGGEGSVWRATNATGAVVAIKQHRAASNWRAESDALRAVTSRHVVRWFGEDERALLIVRECVEGTLADRAIDANREVIYWRRGLLESTTALRDILDAGYAPADLQLANIMLSADGRAVMIDLGHASRGNRPAWLSADWLRDHILRWRGYTLVDTGEPHELIRCGAIRNLEPELADLVDDLDFGTDPIRTFVERLSGMSAAD